MGEELNVLDVGVEVVGRKSAIVTLGSDKSLVVEGKHSVSVRKSKTRTDGMAYIFVTRDSLPLSGPAKELILKELGSGLASIIPSAIGLAMAMGSTELMSDVGGTTHPVRLTVEPETKELTEAQVTGVLKE